MIIEFDKTFYKYLDKISGANVKGRIINIIIEIEKAKSINEIKNIKKLAGFQKYFRIRLGDYRIGFELINSKTIRFILIVHRKDIYKIFP